jgi:ribonuclease HI
MPKPLFLYTDGSALGNPGPGGWAAIIQDGKKDVELSGGEAHTTNNRMEMLAVIEGLKWIKKNQGTERPVKLFSDSSLVVKSLNEGWKRKANQDLWADLDAVLEGFSFTAEWVKGHADNVYNQRCDVLAVSAAEGMAKKASKERASSPEQPSASKGAFACGQCRKSSAGRLGYLPETGMIRVDCAHCGHYIKFAPPTPQNLKKAKERPLVTKAQVKKLQAERLEGGEPLTDRDIKALKGLTLEEARLRFFADQKLF